MESPQEERSPRDEAAAERSTSRDTHSLFLERWSPRAMTGEAVAKDNLMTLFEAARWAPSSSNAQPWRFLYPRRGSEHWERFLALLADGNGKWGVAGALVVLISRKTFERNGKPARPHSLDAGAAWESLALHGTLMNLVVHGTEGGFRGGEP